MLRHKYFKYLLIFLIQIANADAFGQSIKFDKLTVEDGLSQNTINHIIQDQKGFIWFATNGGLNKFDGIEFKAFVYDRDEPNSISSNIINHLYEDRSGNIWISTQNGLNLYHPDTDTFTNFKNEVNNPYSISHNQVNCVVEDDHGKIWIGTAGGGLNLYDPEQGRFKVFRNNLNNTQSLSSNFITCLERDKYGYIWVGTLDEGLNMLDPETQNFTTYSKPASSKLEGHISSNQINVIYEDYEGDLWIGTAAGIDRLIPDIAGRHLSVKDQVINCTKITTMGSMHISSIFQGASGLIWFGTRDHGIWYLNKYLHVSGNYIVEPSNDHSLLSNYVTTVFDDRSAILWIGTNSGINIIDKLKDRFVWHKRTPGTKNTVSSNNIRSIYKSPNGVMWYGTEDQGLSKYDPLSGVYTNFSSNDFVVDGESIMERNQILKRFDKRTSSSPMHPLHFLSHNRVNDIHPISYNYLWIGTGGGGINVLNTRTNSISYLRHIPNNESSLSSDNIKCIYRDSKGRTWVGTEDGGLNMYLKGKFTRFQSDENDLFTISSNNITSIQEDKTGTIWIGTFGGGLNKYDDKSNRFIRYFYKENNADGISSNNIYTIKYNFPDELWIGTADGLNILDIATDRFEHLTNADGLPSNSVYSILDDQSGNFWVSTNRGISRIHKSSFSIKNYDKEDGLQSTEFNPASSFVASNGVMYFGSINGYCSFHPDRITDNTSKPEVVFTNFKILNENVKTGAPGSPLKKNISETDTLILSYKDVSLSFEFVALNFTDARKNQYAYKMENFEDQWNFVGTRRYANYTNLEPGRYTFRVKASNNDGIWNEEGSAIFIIIKPPFWQTWWFYTASGLFLIGLIILSIQIRTRGLHRSKIILEEQVKLRTKQIKSQNKVLENANREIVLQKNEIEKQNILLRQKNVEISNAKLKLDNTNKELLDINTNLEGKVEERTFSLKRINEELVNANNELDRFIYRASHDLKGPIARLLGVSVLAKMDNKDETLKEYIELIEKGAVDINKTLNKLNNIHFINQQNVITDEIDIEKIVENTKSGLSNYIDLEELYINIHKESKFNLRSDQNLIRIILENLLENAVIFRKTTRADIDVLLKTDDRSIIIEVTDKGFGIQKDQHDKIFEMFYRGSQRSKGNGLGLYLVKKAVQKLNGRINLESEEGEFTNVSISLPKVIVSKELSNLVN
jgi:ligand-binding sensor domain-containing protein/signal transduction histidine kinase